MPSQAIQARGFEVAEQAKLHTASGLIKIVVDYFQPWALRKRQKS